MFGKGGAGATMNFALFFVSVQMADTKNQILIKILIPAQRLTFTETNIRGAWEAVGIIPFTPHRVLAGE